MLMSHRLEPHARVRRVPVRMETSERAEARQAAVAARQRLRSAPELHVDGGGAPGSTDEQSLWRMPISGRIVAASAHLHGSANRMTVSQPRCEDRTLIDHNPLYGGPDDTVYRVRPHPARTGADRDRLLPLKHGHPGARGRDAGVTGRYDA